MRPRSALPGGLGIAGWRRLLLAVCAVAAVAVAVAGCGGGGGAAAPQTPAGFVPASAPFYIEIVADPNADQWNQARALAKRFPGYPRLLEHFDELLAENGIVFDRDIRPLLGEGDRAGFALESFADEADGLLAVKVAEGKEADARALIERAASEAGTPTPTERDGVDYWQVDDMVFAVHDGVVLAAEREQTIQAAIEAHDAGGDRVIANLPRYTEVLGKLPADALATMFVNIGAAVAAEDDSDVLTGLRVLGIGQESAVGMALLPLPDGVALKAVGEDIALLRRSETFTPTLLRRVPADVIAAVGFKNFSGIVEGLLEAIQADPELGPEFARIRALFLSGFEEELGVSFDDLRALGAGEGVIAVTDAASSSDAVGVVAVVRQADGARAKQTLDTLRPTLRQLIGFIRFGQGSGSGPVPQWRQVRLANGVTGWQLPIDPEVGIVYAVDGDLLYIGTTPAAVRAVQAPAATLGQDALFRRTAQKVPQVGSIYLWANVQRILSHLDRGGAFREDAELLQNLRPLQAAILTLAGGESTTLDGFVGISE